MANSPQAKKRARQAQKRRLHNDSLESEMNTYVKQVRAAVAANDLEKAKASFAKATQKIDRLAGNRIIHPNRGSRLKSRLNAAIKQASTAA